MNVIHENNLLKKSMYCKLSLSIFAWKHNIRQQKVQKEDMSAKYRKKEGNAHLNKFRLPFDLC